MAQLDTSTLQYLHRRVVFFALHGKDFIFRIFFFLNWKEIVKSGVISGWSDQSKQVNVATWFLVLLIDKENSYWLSRGLYRYIPLYRVLGIIIISNFSHCISKFTGWAIIENCQYTPLHVKAIPRVWRIKMESLLTYRINKLNWHLLCP